eukprot:TRINITY_DN120394_c0_g1_i1.p1 TRINITY_DN120394_c0_g1~~TRINITY_DN120394_c0_g1_i1.p1  ORF type:complete len:614 (-),score=10.35 TRINITY_DN120394_c0_g1_i1:170-1915(-)
MENIRAAPNACNFAYYHCEGESLINFHRLYYCSFNENLPVALIFSVFLPISIPSLFYWQSCFICWVSWPTGSCVLVWQKYARSSRSPKTLLYLLLQQQIPQVGSLIFLQFNGVTFLAFGNGANDVLSAFAAGGGEDEEGIYMSMGAILGSCLFITTVVSSLVVIISKGQIIVCLIDCCGNETQMNKQKFTRDLLVLLIAIAILASFSFIGEIHWIMSLSYILLYAGYSLFKNQDRFIAYVVVSELRKKKKMVFLTVEERMKSSIIQDTSLISTEIAAEPLPKIEAKPETETALEASEPPKGLWQQIKRDAEDILSSTYYIKEYNEMTWFGKGLFLLVGGHFELLLKLSIPPYDKNRWDRRLAILFPVFGGLLTFVQMRVFHIEVLAITFVISLVLSGLIYYSTKKDRPPEYLLLFMFIGFVQSVQWMWFLCNISVDIFKLFIELSDIEPAYVGLTFMACANSIGDIVSDTTMARMGYSVMAITASFAGPIFNVMMGVGITMTRNILKRQPFLFCDKKCSGGMMKFSIKEITDFSQGNMLIFITLFTNIISLAVIIYIVFKNKQILMYKWIQVRVQAKCSED